MPIFNHHNGIDHETLESILMMSIILGTLLGSVWVVVRYLKPHHWYIRKKK